MNKFKTAHEKLIELGWTYQVEYSDLKHERHYYEANWNDDYSIIVDKKAKTVEVNWVYESGYPFDLELAKILTQYLEELENE